ncbi:nesprin-3 isoform X2 [Archocentrus centrarchus]|uniref:nesprin-3 isoform X2 n=1 Tax=Archocentrus centrarchus TaxID=63155 RepID=UPI0011EA3D4F|nr:nesprin-3 isoform X2 [Archocentrus centrarchus]
MTQQEQQEFTDNLEAALSWMRAIQERLKANDNTQGPRDILEARLRETEEIRQSEDEGRVKMDRVLVAAENLLQGGDEQLKSRTHTQLKDLKSLWDETCTYITHCHSRIEWVWLHWTEYLKAYEDFELWLAKQRRSLDVDLELQLGVKEKLWQVDQQRVAVSDIHGQAVLLERLLDEAAALHSRTQDPSVNPQAQEGLQEAYQDVRDRAEERLSLLQRISEEHQMYQDCVQRFQSWLLSKTKELTELMETNDTAENKLKAIQALDDSVACEEKTLQHIEGMVESLRPYTSPGGVEVVVEEAEELRLGWQRLRQGLCEADEGLHSSLDSHSQYTARCQRLGEDIGRLRDLLKGLDQELEETQESREHTDHTEEQMVGEWRTYTDVRKTLAGEESQVELLKAQLKELFRFSEDSRHLSNDVLAVIKEHQSVKCRATRLCSESESGLRNILQDPLLVYAQWRHMVSQVLEASAEVTDFSHVAMLVQNIECLLKESAQLQERFSLLQVKGTLLDSVFGPERSDGLQSELSTAIRNRELLHAQLQQRKSRLQGFISRTKDFGDTYELIRSKLDSFRDRLMAADRLQPDILAKKSQSDQFGVILKDIEECEAQIMALETLVSSSQTNRIQFDKLQDEWKQLHTAVKTKVHQSEESIEEHESFHESLLNIEKWLMIMKQKLMAFHSPSGEWSIEGRRLEAERALGEFPEKELQLQQVDVQSQEVLKKTSAEGQVHILRDMKCLKDSWSALYEMSLNLHRLLNSSKEEGESDFPKVCSSGSVHGGNMEGVTGEEAGWIQGHGEGFHISAGPVKHFISSTVKESELSFKGDEVDFSDGQGVSKDSTTQSPYTTTGGNSSVWSADKEEAALFTQASCAPKGRIHSGEVNMDPGGGLSSGEGGGEFRRVSAPSGTPVQYSVGSQGHSESRRKEFEAWLFKQNELLSDILSSKEAANDASEVKLKHDTLEALRAGVSWGQEQFQLLLQDSQDSGTGPREDVGLEELRYRWMLYKSKLKDVTGVGARTRARAKRVTATQEDAATAAPVQKKPGLLQRVCRLALPLWLLFLALLLLAFLLPLMDEGNSCSLSNNFARSFNIMLRYEGPPPT